MGSTTGARRRVLDTALQCFLSEGYEATTIALITERSGVSNGALFHHFRSKEAIADALYLEAIVSFQQGLWNLLLAQPGSLRAAVRGTIEHQLRWTEEDPDAARFVYMHGHLDWNSPTRTELAARNRELAEAFETLLQPLVESGEVRESSMLVITAIVSGPAHAIARRWLAGYLEGSPTDYVDELADAAWAGIRGQPGGRRAVVAHGARRARVTLELLDEHGEVSARGNADAELAPLAGAPRELAALGPADL
jgi:AcrR family transcriptional regulator